MASSEWRNIKLTQGELKNILSYNHSTGEFYWEERKSGRMMHKQAGFVNRDGYRMIKINYIRYPAHRLAWLWTVGNYPTKELDHINLIKHDNRIMNLRLATKYQNQSNRNMNKNNKIRLKGVRKYQNSNGWSATITSNHRIIHLGTFKTPQEASKAYKQAAIKYHGEFARW